MKGLSKAAEGEISNDDVLGKPQEDVAGAFVFWGEFGVMLWTCKGAAVTLLVRSADDTSVCDMIGADILGIG